MLDLIPHTQQKYFSELKSVTKSLQNASRNIFTTKSLQNASKNLFTAVIIVNIFPHSEKKFFCTQVYDKISAECIQNIFTTKSRQNAHSSEILS